MNDDIFKNKTYYIYKITLNNKCYIGYTKQTPIKRIKQHIYSAQCEGPATVRKGRTKLAYAIRKYGADKIQYEILEVVDGQVEAIKREAFFINKFDSTNSNGYNMLKGGAVIDHSKRDRSFYTSEPYRMLRSQAVRGPKNGRYSGIRDDELIDHAVKLFLDKNTLFFQEWKTFCGKMKYPQVYELDGFRFNGEGKCGFYKAFFERCINSGIDVKFNQIVHRNTRKQEVEKMITVFKLYDPSFLSDNILQEYCSTWDERRVKKTASNVCQRKQKNKNIQTKKEGILVEEAVAFFKTNRNIYYKKWQKHKKEKGLPQSYAKSSFGGKGHVGFLDMFLQSCVKQNIYVEMAQIYSTNNISTINKEILVIYDNYKKNIREKESLRSNS